MTPTIGCSDCEAPNAKGGAELHEVTARSSEVGENNFRNHEANLTR
jgi:hypothetical protein